MPASPSTDPLLVEVLTPREQEILTRFADHRSDREIADELVLSLNTVKWYARQIYGKLGVDNRRMAVLRAQALELLVPATPPSSPPAEHYIPLTPFVGREKELQELHHLLTDGPNRLVTLVGPGGIGKTRLATQIFRTLAEQKSPRFDDGVYFIELAALQEWQMLVHALAHTIGLVFQPDREAPVRQLLTFLRHKQMLLVLDNFEHLITPESTQFLLDLLTQAPQLRILITSRSQLKLYGEQASPLGGLELPEPSALGQRLDVVTSNYSALRLLDQCIRQSRPELNLDEPTLEAMIRICRAVGGMPLAIEMAANWIEVLSLEEIATEVERSLELLDSDLYGIPERQRSLRTVCDYSWRLLTLPEQMAMQQVAVFHGGFDRAAAEAVASVSPKMLLALVSKSWLRRGSDNRFSIHELLRQYCTERLAQEPPTEVATRDRHSAYYCAWLSQQEHGLKGAEQRAALDALAVELANVREGFRWAAHHDHPERLAQAANALGRFFNLTDDRQGGLRLLTESLAALPEAGDEAQGEPALVIRQLARARLMTQLCVLSSWQDGEVLLDRNLSVALSLLNSPGLSAVDTRPQRAVLALKLGRNHYLKKPEFAVEQFSASYELYRALNDMEGMAAAQLGLGRAYRTAGLVEQAREALLEGLAYYEEIGHAFGQSDALGGLSTIAMIQGDFADAERFAEQGLQVVPQKIRYQHAYLLPLLGMAQFHRGSFAEAATAVATTINMQLEDGQVPLATVNMTRLTQILLHQGKYPQVLRQIDAAHANASTVRDGSGIYEVVAYVRKWMYGAVALAEGHYAEAHTHLEQALAVWTPVGYGRYDRSRIMVCHALALRALGRHEESRVQSAAGLKDALQNKSYLGLLLSLTARALFAVNQGNVAHAVELYTTVATQPLAAHSVWYADIAGKALAEAASDLTDEVVAKARHNGEHADLWETAQALADSMP